MIYIENVLKINKLIITLPAINSFVYARHLLCARSLLTSFDIGVTYDLMNNKNIADIRNNS